MSMKKRDKDEYNRNSGLVIRTLNLRKYDVVMAEILVKLGYYTSVSELARHAVSDRIERDLKIYLHKAEFINENRDIPIKNPYEIPEDIMEYIRDVTKNYKHIRNIQI